jgi:hypothetical protein
LSRLLKLSDRPSTSTCCFTPAMPVLLHPAPYVRRGQGLAIPRRLALPVQDGSLDFFSRLREVCPRDQP